MYCAEYYVHCAGHQFEFEICLKLLKDVNIDLPLFCFHLVHPEGPHLEGRRPAQRRVASCAAASWSVALVRVHLDGLFSFSVEILCLDVE